MFKQCLWLIKDQLYITYIDTATSFYIVVFTLKLISVSLLNGLEMFYNLAKMT